MLKPAGLRLFLTLGLVSMGLTAFAAEAPKLEIDATPLNRGPGGLVTSYADVVEPVQQAVVSVYSTKIVRTPMRVNPLLRQFFGEVPERESRQEGLGSGVIISSDGYILTNNHVIEEADELEVLLTDGREMSAKLIGTDPKTDVAVIKIEATDLPIVTLADSDILRVGDVVFAVGNPLGIGQTVTMGIISATGRKDLGILDDGAGYEDFIQTDAAINMGNSGGALVDAQGRLIGINTAIISPTRGSIGIGFAIPVNLAASVMNSLVSTGTVQRGFLGVTVDKLTPELAEAFGLKASRKGVVVNDITEDGPADKAGLLRGDVVFSVNGREVASLQDLRLQVTRYQPGTAVDLAINREGEAMTLSVELGGQPEAIAQADILEGVTVTTIDDTLREEMRLPSELKGAVVSELDPRSPYAGRLALGMIIVEVNREPVDSAGAVTAQLVKGRNLLLVYYRGVYRHIPVTMP